MEVEENNSKTLHDNLALRVYPNPGHDQVAISYVLKQGEPVQCRVYDASGRIARKIVSAYQPAGEQSATWDRKDQNGRTVTAGVYFVRVQTGSEVNQVKLVIVD